jgi:hypothetical protein
MVVRRIIDNYKKYRGMAQEAISEDRRDLGSQFYAIIFLQDGAILAMTI